jgi:nucleotide-binding universal stress UspA family protein
MPAEAPLVRGLLNRPRRRDPLAAPSGYDRTHLQGGSVGHVFISYSRDDRAYVERLAAHLEAAGVDVWFDYEIGSGERWSTVIERKIETCDAMIVVMSPAARSSEMVENEIDLARSRGKRFVPLLLGGEPFFGLRHIQYTDVRGGMLPGSVFLSQLPGTDRPEPARSTLPKPPQKTAATDVPSAPKGPVHPWLAHTLRGHKNRVSSLAWSPDGIHLATCNLLRSVYIWANFDGSDRRTLDRRDALAHVAWSPNGKRLACGGQASVEFSDPLTGVFQSSLANRSAVGRTHPVTSVAWSPDGSQIAASGADGKVRTWETYAGKRRLTLNTNTRYSSVLGVCVAWSPDGTMLAGAGDEGTAIWDPTTGRRQHELAAGFSAAWSPDGTRLAIGATRGIHIWNTRTDQLTIDTRSIVVSLAWSPDGFYLAAAVGDVIEIWNPDTGDHLTTLTGHTGRVSSVAWSALGYYLASGSADKTACIWDVGDLS